MAGVLLQCQDSQLSHSLAAGMLLSAVNLLSALRLHAHLHLNLYCIAGRHCTSAGHVVCTCHSATNTLMLAALQKQVQNDCSCLVDLLNLGAGAAGSATC